MATHVIEQSGNVIEVQTRRDTAADALRVLAPIGRLCFVVIFLMSAPLHFSRMGIDYAASQGVPAAGLLVPLSGALALLGGLSVLLGWKTRWGALLLILFIVPVTLGMHRFWDVADTQAAMLQRVMFLKNLSILGGALLLAYFGGGPLSIDAATDRGSPSRPTPLA